MKSNKMLVCLFFTLWISSTAAAESLVIGSSKLAISIETTPKNLEKKDILHWIQAGASAVEKFCGHFPVPRLKIEVRENTRDPTGVFGQERDGAIVKLYLGKEVAADTLKHDWTFTHELLHLAFPDLEDKYLWAEEGLSTYLEPLVRVRNGMITEVELWQLYYDGMSRGIPLAGDKGLNKTHTWARTYWGGALFWFTVDFRLRKQTQFSIQDIIRGILAKGGDARHSWSMEKVIEIGDKAVDSKILRDSYEEMAMHPSIPDLSTRWQELGIESKDGRVVLKDSELRNRWLK